MDEYINRDKLNELIDREIEVCNSGMIRGELEYLKAIVPVADDVVKVVRCKDCTYYEGDCCGFWEEYPKTEKNDFCSNGKKRAK